MKIDLPFSPAQSWPDPDVIVHPSAEGDERPRPLLRLMKPASPFPVQRLGPTLEPAARAIHARIKAPMAVCGQSVLAAAALVAQSRANIELPSSGQLRPLSLYLITIAASGERKTSCDHEALWPIHKHERNLRATYDSDRLRWQNSSDLWKKQRQQALGSSRDGDGAAIAADLAALGAEPAAPLHPMMMCPEPTFEGLCRLLSEGQPSVGLFSAEGGQFVGGHGMSAEHKLKTAAALSSAWDGDPIRRVRAGDGLMLLSGRRVCLHLMMQPGVASMLLGDPEIADQGLLSRMLPTAPDSAAGTRFLTDVDLIEQGSEDLHRFGARLLDILELPLSVAEGSRQELDLPTLRFDRHARAMWVDYANTVEGELALGGPREPIRAFSNKLPEHAARIGAVLAIIAEAQAETLSVEWLAHGIALAEYYASEVLRLHEAGRAEPSLLLAQKALDWLRDDWRDPLISAPDFYQLGPSGIRNAKTARDVIKTLEDHLWLKRHDGPATIRGERRREAWRINRG